MLVETHKIILINTNEDLIYLDTPTSATRDTHSHTESCKAYCTADKANSWVHFETGVDIGIFVALHFKVYSVKSTIQYVKCAHKHDTVGT